MSGRPLYFRKEHCYLQLKLHYEISLWVICGRTTAKGKKTGGFGKHNPQRNARSQKWQIRQAFVDEQGVYMGFIMARELL